MPRLQKVTSQMGIVFYATLAISAVFILWGVLFTENLDQVTADMLGFVVVNLPWFYLLVTTFFLGFVVFLAIGPYGKLRLGKEGEEPEFGRFAWFAMLFQAGMGIGVIFWGVSEPVMHYADPPFDGAAPSTTEAANLAM